MSPLEIVQQLQALEPSIAEAYLDEIRQTVDAATLAEVERLLAAGQPNQAADLLKYAGFILLLESLRQAYMQAGKLEARDIRVGGFKPKIDPAGERVQAWFRELAQDVRQKADEAKRAAVVTTYEQGLVQGRTPRQIALDVIGRIAPETGRRSGGTLALAEQAIDVSRARAQLLSGDPEQMRAYLTRVRRDPRLDGIVQRAIEAEKPVAKADADRIVGRYADRLLLFKAEQAAKLRSLEAYGAARDEVYRTMIDSGFSAGTISKTWKTRRDEKVRHSHARLDGTVVGFEQTFVSENGSAMRFPGDSSLGATLGDLIGCRCSAIYKVRFT